MKIIECPRDAMQGLADFIPTKEKASYINKLLKVGFDTIDFGSFVSPKAIPQLKDTAEVLSQLDLENTDSKLLSIVANLKGAEIASEFSEIQYLGFPFSISETFQHKNTHKTISQSFETLQRIQEIALKKEKEIVVYLSMAFGNPYDEEFNIDQILNQTEMLKKEGIKIVSLSDTIGVANRELVSTTFKQCLEAFPELEWGAHFHTVYSEWFDKVDAAYTAGCRRFDGAIKGFGGCPYAKEELVGNMPTEKLLSYLQHKKIEMPVNMLKFESAYNSALDVFK